ncbi:MAG: hypothetical protein GY727_15205 [Gammaproteobacteria bacterium]|nr:hypothetical protein [Gammaproteobacteria bacterium]
MELYAHAISQVDTTRKGIHLLWSGPQSWVYSPDGWLLERRQFKPTKSKKVCDLLNESNINQLRISRERELTLGMVTLREGSWLLNLSVATFSVVQPRSDVFQFEFFNSHPRVEVKVTAKYSFAFGLRKGKVVATSTSPVAGTATHVLLAVSIDEVIVYTLSPSSLQFCVHKQLAVQNNEWTIIARLQLPLRELISTLSSDDDEFILAKSRLLPGEDIDAVAFKDLADIIRNVVSFEGRPIERTLLMRLNTDSDLEELEGLAPILSLLSDPMWRRVLGFAWFDQKDLELGMSYEYRITGRFPASDLSDEIFGFHTIPSKTTIPAIFFLGNLRVRIPEPTTISFDPAVSINDNINLIRRGIELVPRSSIPWIVSYLSDWSLILDFPHTITSLDLELSKQHELFFAVGSMLGGVFAVNPLPPGPEVHLEFATPIDQLRLSGKGFLKAVRIPSANDNKVPLSCELSPIRFENSPLPETPIIFSTSNLQQQTIAPTTDMPSGDTPRKSALGIKLKWRPALKDGVIVWPADEHRAPPMDANLFEIEHRKVFPIGSILPILPTPPLNTTINPISTEEASYFNHETSPYHSTNAEEIIESDLMAFNALSIWHPLLEDKNNWLTGDRDQNTYVTQTYPGVDLLSLFPEGHKITEGEKFDLIWRDVFDFNTEGLIARPVPKPGTFHQYRIRAIDPVGRPSADWKFSNILQLKKLLPPPIPVGPTEIRADQLTAPELLGVQARALVKDAPDLTESDQILLGFSDNAIVLRWGWHDDQRILDPFATEFRVYLRRSGIDGVSGQITDSVELSNGRYQISIELEQQVAENTAIGEYLKAPWPFYIIEHTEGQIITAIIETKIPDKNGLFPIPELSLIEFPAPLTPNQTRPPAWDKRVASVPIDERSSYDFILLDQFNINADNPSETLWLGVSTADDQPYVADQLSPLETKSGNESAIVPVRVDARYYGQPNFDIAPPLEPVPIMVTPEPRDQPVVFKLSLQEFIEYTGLTSTDSIRPSYINANEVFRAYRVDGDRIMARAGDEQPMANDQEVLVPNPTDALAIRDALIGGDAEKLIDQYVVYLAGKHPFRDSLFQPAVSDDVLNKEFEVTLPPEGRRYVFRVQKTDAAKHVSSGDAVAALIVRVPTAIASGVPVRLPAQAEDAPGTLRLALPDDVIVTHLAIFKLLSMSANTRMETAELLRPRRAVASQPGDISLRLRTPDDTLLSPELIPLNGLSIDESTRQRQLELNFAAAPGERITIWSCCVTDDNVASKLAGPWGLQIPVADLVAADLTVSGTLDDLMLTWSWPSGADKNKVAVERSIDNDNWIRISPLTDKIGYRLLKQPANAHYRLQIFAADGRTVSSNVVNLE